MSTLYLRKWQASWARTREARKTHVSGERKNDHNANQHVLSFPFVNVHACAPSPPRTHHGAHAKVVQNNATHRLFKDLCMFTGQKANTTWRHPALANAVTVYGFLSAAFPMNRVAGVVVKPQILNAVNSTVSPGYISSLLEGRNMYHLICATNLSKASCLSCERPLRNSVKRFDCN